MPFTTGITLAATTAGNEDPCQTAAHLAASPVHRSILCFKIFTCFCGLIGDVWIWKHEGIRWLGHPNAQVLYSLHLFWATVVSVSYAAPMIFDLFRFLSFKDNECDYLIPVFQSFWIRFVPAYAIDAQSSAICALTIERTIASFFLKQYEKVKKPYLGVVLFILAIVLPFIQLYVLIVSPNHWLGRVVATSILTTDNTDFFSIYLRIKQIMESTTLFFFVFTFILNRIQLWKIKVKETSKVITSLLPCFCVHFFIFYGPPIVLSWIRNMDPTLSTVDTYRWIEITSEFQLYSLLMPLSIYLLRRRQKKKIVINSHRAVHWTLRNELILCQFSPNPLFQPSPYQAIIIDADSVTLVRFNGEILQFVAKKYITLGLSILMKNGELKTFFGRCLEVTDAVHKAHINYEATGDIEE